MHLAAVPGFQVRQNHGTRADLELGVFLVNIDQIHGKLKGYLHIPVRFEVSDLSIHEIPADRRVHDGARTGQGVFGIVMPDVDIVALELLLQRGSPGFGGFGAWSPRYGDAQTPAEGHAPFVAGDLEEVSAGDRIFRAARRTKVQIGLVSRFEVFHGTGRLQMEPHLVGLSRYPDEPSGVLVDRIGFPGPGSPVEGGAVECDHGCGFIGVGVSGQPGLKRVSRACFVSMRQCPIMTHSTHAGNTKLMPRRMVRDRDFCCERSTGTLH